jgi:hypothetical protein
MTTIKVLSHPGANLFTYDVSLSPSQNSDVVDALCVNIITAAFVRFLVAHGWMLHPFVTIAHRWIQLVLPIVVGNLP